MTTTSASTPRLPSIWLVEPTGSYVPGACNIGPAEISRRRRSGWLGLGAAVALAAIGLAAGAPAWSRLVVGIPLFSSAVGFLQARERFCVGFAAAGLTNFEALGTLHRVDDPAARAADRRHAARLVAKAAAIAAVAAVVLVLLPV